MESVSAPGLALSVKVHRCPTAYIGPSTGVISATDRKALREHAEKRANRIIELPRAVDCETLKADEAAAKLRRKIDG